MSFDLIPFMFENETIRTIVIDGDPWFVGKDIATALGYVDTKQAVRDNCKRAKSLIDMGAAKNKPYVNKGLELDPQTKLIPEPDIYRLISNSRLPSAERFEAWIFDEVLPLTKKAAELINALNNFEVPDDLPDMYVYAIRERETGNVKLGISRDPHKRLQQLQTGNSNTLELVAYRKAENRFDDERALHNDAADYHIRGEWFTSHALKVM